jgi:hypothetical protein
MSTPIDVDLDSDDLGAVLSCKTLADCDEARQVLDYEIATLDGWVTIAGAKQFSTGHLENPAVFAHWKTALRRKRVALQRLQDIAAAIRRAERQTHNDTRERLLLAIIRETHPGIVDEAIEIGKQRRPELWS